MLALGDEVGAVNRSYYAVFDAMRAVLTEVAGIDVRSIKTHTGVTRAFEVAIVKPGLIERPTARTVKRIAERRWAADYGSEMSTGANFAPVLRDARTFLDACVTLLASRSES